MILGAGVILLLILWTATALLWVLFPDSSPQHSRNRTIVAIFSAVLTLILVLLPTSSKDGGFSIVTTTTPDYDASQRLVAYDYLFIWRVILIIILVLSILVGFGLIVSQFWTQKVHGSNPIPLKMKS